TGLAPQMQEAFTALGMLLADSPHPEQGINFCEEAADQIAADPVAHECLGKLFRIGGRFADAAREYHQVVSLRPRDARSFEALGWVLVAQVEGSENAVAASVLPLANAAASASPAPSSVTTGATPFAVPSP